MGPHRSASATRDDPPGDQLDEEAIALRAIDDPAAFAPLYRRYLPEIRGLCARRLGYGPDADDVAAEVFHKVLRKRHTFRGGSFRAWIYTIAINTVRDHASGPLPPSELLESVSDPSPGPEELALRAASAAELRVALDRLSADWQLVVELRNQGYSCAEVARAVGRDPDWVSVTHHRAMARLARELGAERGRMARRG